MEKSKDYELTVSVVDVDEREEAKLNVLLNNPSMQGDWDLDKLGMMTEDFGLDPIKDLGFTESDVDFLFEGDERFSKLFETQEGEDMRGKLEEIKASKQQSREKLKEANSIQWFTVIVFENEEERKSFHKEIGIPIHEQYITADQVHRLND